MIDVILLLITVGFSVAVLYFFVVLYKKFLTDFTSQTVVLVDTNQKQIERFFEIIKEMQIHDSVVTSKMVQKQWDEYQKQQKELLKFFTPKPYHSPVEKDMSHVLNDIEKEEVKDIPITEDMKVPIVDGMKIQFEGDDESTPIVIN